MRDGDPSPSGDWEEIAPSFDVIGIPVASLQQAAEAIGNIGHRSSPGHNRKVSTGFDGDFPLIGSGSLPFHHVGTHEIPSLIAVDNSVLLGLAAWKPMSIHQAHLPLLPSHCHDQPRMYLFKVKV